MRTTIKENKNTHGKRLMDAFWGGWMSTFDLSGGAYEWLPDFPDFSRGFDRDREAIAGDWRRVGDDMRKVMSQIACER
jgi:hypothetical protein